MEHCDIGEEEEAEIKSEKYKRQKKYLYLNLNLIKKQTENEAVMIDDVGGQVGEGIEQFLESEVNKDMFYAEVNKNIFSDEGIQQDVIEPKDKAFKENVPQDVGELFSEEEEAEMKGKQMEE